MLKNKLNNQETVEFSKKLLMGMSGGPDSIKLWISLDQSCEIGAQKFGIVTCNHGWQTPNFTLSEEIARMSFLNRKNFHFIATARCLKSEQVARIWRYNVFVRLVDLKHYSQLVLGHSWSDWIETLLIYLFRGFGF